MSGKSRQQRANTKARKAKGRDPSNQRGWQQWNNKQRERERHQASRRHLGSLDVMAMGVSMFRHDPMAEMMGLLDPRSAEERRESLERLLCRAFGEEYRP